MQVAVVACGCYREDSSVGEQRCAAPYREGWREVMLVQMEEEEYDRG